MSAHLATLVEPDFLHIMYHGVCTQIRDRTVVLSELEMVSMSFYSSAISSLYIVCQWSEFP